MLSMLIGLVGDAQTGRARTLSISRAKLYAAGGVAALVAITGSASAVASPSIGVIAEYPLPVASSNPSWITGGLPVGINGDLWFTLQPNTQTLGNKLSLGCCLGTWGNASVEVV